MKEQYTVVSMASSSIFSTILGLLRELGMIVIGILIAIQIEGWASDRMDLKDLKGNLNYVLEDLEKNREELLVIKEAKSNSIEKCTQLIDHYKQGLSMQPEKIVTTLSEILKTNKFKHHEDGFSRVSLSPAYESDEFLDVRNEIRAYQGKLKDLRNSEEFINAYIGLLSLEMSKEGALLSVFDHIRVKDQIASYTTTVPTFTVSQILDKNKPLQAVLHKYEFDAQDLVKNYEALLQAGTSLENTILSYMED